MCPRTHCEVAIPISQSQSSNPIPHSRLPITSPNHVFQLRSPVTFSNHVLLLRLPITSPKLRLPSHRRQRNAVFIGDVGRFGPFCIVSAPCRQQNDQFFCDTDHRLKDSPVPCIPGLIVKWPFPLANPSPQVPCIQDSFRGRHSEATADLCHWDIVLAQEVLPNLFLVLVGKLIYRHLAQ